MTDLSYLEKYLLVISIIYGITIYVALFIYFKRRNKQKLTDIDTTNKPRDRNYYIYQLLKKTIKEYSYKEFDIVSYSKGEYSIKSTPLSTNTLFDLRKFLKENILKDIGVIVYINKQHKELEIITYDKNRDINLTGNSEIQVHQKGNFTIVTAKQ